MSLTTNYVVYQAYGSLDNLNEVIYSIASLYHQINERPVSVVIYTDNMEYLQKYLPSSVIYQELTSSQLTKWRGEINFVHRVKVEILINFCSLYSGNVLYLDTDTIFTQSTDNVFAAVNNDILVMHTNEGRMCYTRNRVFDKIVRFINNKPLNVSAENISISVDQEIWNAGVLGFKSEKISLLNKVLVLTDTLYKQFQKHIMEQLAFSYVFTKNGLLVAAENHIFHYWNFKEFRPLLKEYFQEQDTFEKVLKNFETINPSRLIIPKINFEKQPHLLQQFKKHIIKQKWYMPNYEQIKGKL